MKAHRKTQRHAPGRKPTTRPTLGLFTNSLGGFYQAQWLGAIDAARAYEANLICFVGRELGQPDNFYAQANVIYDLVSPEQFNGLIIWTTSLQAIVGQQQIELFCQRYHPLPIVSVEQVLEGLPSVLMDDRHGMRAAVSHLIAVHGYRRIAFIRGPANHSGAQERYAGYLEALAQHGLPLDPTLVSSYPRFWRPEESAPLAHQLLDARIAPIEAIVAANDTLALGVLSALQARHIRVPDDMAVVGFDNHVDVGSVAGVEIEGAVTSRATTLPLTTVQPPFYQLGFRAVELLLAQLRGEAVPTVVTIPTELVLRRSCGCFSEAVQQLAPVSLRRKPEPGPLEPAITAVIATERAAIITRLGQAMQQTPAAFAPEWADQLVTVYLQEVQGESSNAFLVALDELVRSSVRSGTSLERWWQVLFALRQQTLPYLGAGEALARAEALWQRVQVLMGEMAERFYSYQQAVVEKRDEVVRAIGLKLITTFDLGQLAEILAEELPKLGVPGCYLALYERPSRGADGAQSEPGVEGYPTELSRSIFVYENGQRLEVAASEAVFPSRHLAPGERLRHTQPYSVVVEALYFQEQQLGFVLFEVGPRTGWVYEALRGQLSSALQGALLVEREKRALAERAQLLEQTQEKNRLLQQEIRQRQQTEAALQKAHDELEQRVAERTAALAQANEILTEQILERERLEAQLRQAQKMEAIGQLAGGIAHDFNNLLVVINGYSDLLLSSVDAESSLRQDLEQIQHAGERAATLTRQLLAFSRKQILQPRVLSLNGVVTNLEPMLQRLIGEDIKLTTALTPNLALVHTDPGQIEQMIVNLVVNARDAMPQGGRLTITTSNVDLDADNARQQVGVQAGAYVRLRVSDTGVGMDAATKARMFEPFFTTKPQGKGTGLGLATVFGIVQQSSGHITVASEQGLGTTFSIYLPQAAPAVEANPAHVAPARTEWSGAETILVVEDDPGVRVATRRFLEEYGYTVLEASHGLEALRLCQQHDGLIDLLITDVVMPGMSGRELVQRMVGVCPELPVLYVSGYTDSAIIRHGLAEATIALLQKPFTADDLARNVRELLDSGPGT